MTRSPRLSVRESVRHSNIVVYLLVIIRSTCAHLPLDGAKLDVGHSHCSPLLHISTRSLHYLISTRSLHYLINGTIDKLRLSVWSYPTWREKRREDRDIYFSPLTLIKNAFSLLSFLPVSTERKPRAGKAKTHRRNNQYLHKLSNTQSSPTRLAFYCTTERNRWE